MKKQSRNTRGPGAWVLGGVASLLMCVSAFGQYVATQSTPIAIPDSGTGTPYPSSIDLTKSNIIGVIEKVSVTVSGLTHPSAPDLGFLLVGPNSKAVVLLSGSGASSSGNASLNNATFTFSDDATGGAPANSPLVSGSSYKPTDNAGLSFLPPAPTSGYITKLGDAFASTDPNGIWKLYVLDTTAGPGGGPSPVLGSWSLNLNTTPTFTIVTNASTVESTTHQITTTVPENGSVGVGLVLQSSSTPVANLTVSATKIPTLVTNFSTSGTDQNRTLTITPNATTFGTNTLVIKVDDGIGSVTTNITLAVTHTNQAPTIALSTNTLTTVSGFMTTNIVIATVADADINFDPASVANLNLTATSSDPSIVSSNGVFFGLFTAGGDKRTVTVIPNGTGTGTATLTINVDDGALTNSATLTVTVLPVSYKTFANSSTISAPAAGSGNSTIVIPANTVAGLVGSATIFVNGWKNVTPASTTFTLTPPGGTPITLFANSGSSSARNYGQVFFVDGVAGTLPSSDDVTNTISLAPPAQIGGTNGALSGVNPNGTWTLTVQNNGAVAAQILDGWTLNLFAAPVVGSIADVRAAEESTSIVNFTVGSINGSVTNVFGRINANPALAKITGSVNGNNASLTIVGNFNQFGTNIVEVVGQDNNGFYGTNTFTLALFFVNHAPTIDVIQRQVVAAGGVLGPIPVTVRDVDTLSNGISSVTVRANSSDQKFLPDANILLLPAGTGTATSSNYTLTLFPVGAISGNVNVTITANDGLLNGTTTFNLTIQPPGNPLFVNANAITVNANGPGSPYGSTNNVSGLIGKVQKVSVSLFGINVPTPGNAKFLLVGPTGANVLLMSGSGGTSGSTGLTNTALVFDDASTVSLPSSSQIISGVYKPTQNGTTSLPPPAPASPYGGDFSGFNGTNPNGNWALYVADTGSAKGGIISGTWQLSIQTSPSIPAIADQSTPENVTARISVTVGDNQPGVGLNVVATGDPTLFVAPIAVSGSGATRTLTIVPVPFKVGTNVITVTATDTNTSKSSTQPFNMAVQAVAQPPLFVTTPADQTVPAATQLPPVSFQVWPPQGSPLTLTASSTDNPTLIPSGNIDISQTGTVNGTTNVYSLTLIPAGVLTGTGTVSIVAADTNGLKSTVNFKVIVTTSLAFANTNTIIIPEGLPAVGVATPYPSLVSVKGLGGLISEAKVTLVGFTHSHPEDVDILLVSPDRSKSVILMAKAGSGGPVSDLRLNFADGTPPNPPIPALGPLVDGTYSPADYSSGVTLPSPATVRPYTTTLSSFNGLSPNGDWQLYVLDDTFPSGGSINNGWVLSLKTAPAIAPIGPVTTSENTQVIVPVLLSDATVNETNLVVTVAHSLESVPDLATNLVLTGTGANLTLTITPTTNLPSAYNAQHSLTNLAGTNVITITAKDPINNLTTVSSFVLKVLYVNQSPTVTTATNGVYVDENTFTNIAYTVGDVDSIMDRSNIVVTSSDQSLLANSNIVVTGNAIAAGATGTINVKVTPTKNTHGSLTLSFVASDTNSFTTNLVTLNINHIWQQPTISAIPAQSAVAGSSTTNIAFTVGSVEVSTKNLTVFAKSDNPAIVPNSPANIVFSGSGDSRFIQLFTIGSASGTATITVFVTDNSGNASSTNSTNFALTATSVANSFANTNAITTAGAGKANIYPSPITVSGLLGGTYKVSVTLPNFSHSSPANLDVLLVGNKTNAVVLMSGVGGTNAASNLRLVFAESGVPLPSDSLSSATYLPGNATGSKLVLPSPAPTNTIWSATLSAAFAGKDANGLWELYVNDRGAGDVGNIANGWQLVVQTAPTIALAAGTPSPLVFPENSTTNVTLNIGDIAIDISNLVVSATSDNAVLLPVRNITFAGTPSGHSGTVTATLAPAALQNGSANVNFIVTRSDGASSSVKLPISVTPVNVPSTVSRLDPISMPENGTSNVVFLVHDDDTPLGNLIVQATSGAGDQGLIPNANLSFNGLNTNRLVGLPSSGAPGTSLLTLTITPKLFQAGTATVTITVTDPGPAGTNTITTNFTVTVNSVIFPPFFISVPGPQSVAAGGAISNVAFAVAHPVDAASTLTMSGSSSDQSLVKNSDIIFGGAGTNRTVTVLAQGNTSGGTASITLKVTDPATANNFATTNFALTVRPSRVHNYTNSTIIHIIDNAVADLYPSQININNLGGPVAKITATLNGFTHTFPSDVGILLVGPTGQKIVLMSNVGGGHPGATNLFLTFDQIASGTIPANGPIVAGTFMPLDNSGGLRTFGSPAPGTPYTNTLNAFNGTNGNGTWSLYVEDFSPPDAGAISNGWSLGITTLPTISGLTDITVKEDTAAVQNFTVSDDTPSTPTFTFSAASDNQSVVTNAGVVFTGSGTNWTVTVNPVLHASGSANITVTMVNGDGQTVTSKFKATFTPVAYPPDLFPIPNQTIAAGTAASVPVNYGNIGYSQSWLTVTFDSSNTNLVPVGNMKLSGTNLLISPVGVQQGTATITVTVINTNTPPQSTNTSFKLSVLPNPLPVFAASGTIVINDNAAATPYPSTIHVSGVGTNIAAVTVSLVGFGHQFPSDVSVLLVGPQGQKVVLMSRAGTSFPITNTRLTIDDSAPAALPQFAMITDGTYKPTDYKVSDTFFAPAPLAPYSHALNVFNGSNPNGDWQLFVQDDQPQESGVITGGWVLAITTSGPSISNPGPTTIVENSVSNIINFSVSSPTVNASNLIVTATNTADSPKGIISSLTVGGSGSSRFVVVTPGLNLPSLVTTNDGTSTITLTVSDGSATNSASFLLTVSYVNQPPTMNPSVLQNLTTPANVPISTSFSLVDVDTPVSNLVVSATTTVPGLGTATVSTVGSNSTVAYTPKGFVGTNIVKITVQDGGNTISNGFVVVTTASLPPTLAAIAPQSTPGAPTNSTKSVTLNVSPATGIPGFTFTGTTTNHALVSSVTFTTNANSVVANLNIVGAMVGFDFVTITVSDKNTNSTKSFPLTVTPTGVVTLAPIAAQSTLINVAAKVALTASSPDTAVSNLHFTGSSTNSFLVSGFSFAYNGRNMIATINLINNRIGKDFVTISTTDGFSTASQSFVLTVTGTPTNSAPQLTLSASGGKLTLNLQGSPNTGYTIQGAASLAQPITWGTITNLTADATGRASFTATPAAGVPVQFIRAKSP